MTTDDPTDPDGLDEADTSDEPDDLIEDLTYPGEDPDDDGDLAEQTSDGPRGATHSLADLVVEHGRSRIGELWVGEIRTAVARVARRYPPQRYNAGASWDAHALDDLCQDVVVRLLRKSQVEYICDTANDLSHARALLRRQVRLTLIDRRRRTAIDNLVSRAIKRLDEPPFTRTETEPTTWVRDSAPTSGPELADGPSQPQRVQLVQRLSALPRARHKGLKRANRVWNAETLKTALDDLVVTFGTVSRQQIQETFADALTWLNVSEFVDVEATEKFVASELGPEEETMVTEIVNNAVASLTEEESAVLAGKFRGLSDDEVGKYLGRSRPTIASRKQSGAAKVREATLDLDLETQNEVLERVQVRILEVNQ